MSQRSNSNIRPEKINKIINLTEILARSNKLELGTLRNMMEMTGNKNAMLHLHQRLSHYLPPTFTRSKAFDVAVKLQSNEIKKFIETLTPESILSIGMSSPIGADEMTDMAIELKYKNFFVNVEINFPVPREFSRNKKPFLFNQIKSHGYQRTANNMENFVTYSLKGTRDILLQKYHIPNGSNRTVVKALKKLDEMENLINSKNGSFITSDPYDDYNYSNTLGVYISETNQIARFDLYTCAVVQNGVVLVNPRNSVLAAAWIQNAPLFLKAYKKLAKTSHARNYERIVVPIKKYFATNDRFKVEKSIASSYMYFDNTKIGVRGLPKLHFYPIRPILEVINRDEFFETVSGVPITLNSPSQSKSSVKLSASASSA